MPLMTDSYWDKDTVFFVFEEDYRFRDVPLMPLTEFLDPLAAEAGPGEEFAPKPLLKRPAAKKFKAQWFEHPEKVQEVDEDEPAAFHVSDLMHYVIQSSRVCEGGVWWLGWQPGHAGSNPQRKGQPSFGSFLVACSVGGAHQLADAMDTAKFPRGHFDLSLKYWLQTEGRAVGGFVHPPIGNYFTSSSSIDPQYSKERGGVRLSCWGDSWCCPGTRKDQDRRGRDKWLAAATKKGPPDWILKLKDPEDEPDLTWKTYEPPTGEPAASSLVRDEPPLPSPADAPEKYGGVKIAEKWVKELDA